MSPSPQLPNLSFARWILLALLATALLSPSAQTQTARPAPDERERAIRQSDMLDHMDEIRQHYPKLYDRLRRSPAALDQAPDQAAVHAAPKTPPPASFEQRLRQTVPARRAP